MADNNIGMTIKGDASGLKTALTGAGKDVETFGNNAEKYLQKGEVSAKQLAFATRGLPAQFTDIVVSLQAGQNPFTVFLQQGGQIKDMFGGIGPAVKAMGGYVLGLINPYMLAGAAAVTLAAAWYKGSQEAHEYNKAIILSGNAAGVTLNQLQGMADNVHKMSGATVGAAAEALAEFTRNGNVAAGNYEKFSAVAIGLQKLTGQSVAETVKQFSELGKDPLTASLKLNDSTHYLTTSIYEQIKALMEQGRTLEAGVVAQNAYADSTLKRIPSLVENLGYVERAWNAITGAIKGAGSAVAGIGRPEGNPVDLMRAQLNDAIAKATSAPGQPIHPNQQRAIDLLKEGLKIAEKAEYFQQVSAQHSATNVKNLENKLAFDKSTEQYQSNAVKREKALLELANQWRALAPADKTEAAGEAYLVAEAKIKEQYKDIRNTAEDAYLSIHKGIRQTIDLAEEELGIKHKLTDAEKYQITVTAAITDGLAKKTITQQRALQLQKELGQAVKDLDARDLQRLVNKGLDVAAAGRVADAEDAAAYERRMIDANNNMAISIDNENRATRDNLGLMDLQLRMFGATSVQMAVSIAQYKEKLELEKQIKAIDAMDYPGGEADREAARQKARAASQARLGATTRQLEQSEWDKTATGIQDSLTGAFMDSVMTGKSMFANLRDSVVSEFSNLVLRPIIKSVMSGPASWLASAFGFAGGGVMSSAGPVPLQSYSGGGIADRPQLALFGEGRMKEAFVPLPDGRSIPVSMKGGGQSINITINASVGDIASKSDVVSGMRVVSNQIVEKISRSQRYGGGLA